MLPRASRVLDAGCGQGRVGAELAARGHRVTGVDADAGLIETARADHPGSRWVVADLAELDLRSTADSALFVASATEEHRRGRAGDRASLRNLGSAAMAIRIAVLCHRAQTVTGDSALCVPRHARTSTDRADAGLAVSGR
jgi:SAM-dependent methyltransferase